MRYWIVLVECLGNISSPGINRWGSNLFWYNFWFNDKKRNQNIHLDSLINELVYVYVKYGLYSNKSLFLNKIRFFNFDDQIKKYQLRHDSAYFRSVEFKNRVLNETNILKIRIGKKNTYKSRIWILKYQNWLVINYYCFQPLTKKNKKRNIFRKRSVDAVVESNKCSSSILFKYGVFFNFFFNKFNSTNPYYSF